MSVCTLFLILFFPTLAIDYMNRGMKLCVSTLIPSLFPFMVASELIVMTGAARPLGKILRVPAGWLCGISEEGSSALVLGCVCGFPIGTRAAVSLYKRGRITFCELSRLVCFSNNPSSGFIISAVGATLFGSREFGTALFFITVLSSMCVGVIQNVLLGRRNDVLPVSQNPPDSVEKKEREKGIAEFSSAISSSAYALLGVCAFVIFFSTLTGTLGVLLSRLGASQMIRAVFFSFFELTGGVAEAASLSPVLCAVSVAAFAVGWSGLSVHLQMIGVCDGIPIPIGRYFLAKLSQGILNVALVLLYFKLFGDTVTFDVKSVDAFLEIGEKTNALSFAVSAVFFACLALAVFVRSKKRIT